MSHNLWYTNLLWDFSCTLDVTSLTVSSGQALVHLCYHKQSPACVCLPHTTISACVAVGLMSCNSSVHRSQTSMVTWPRADTLMSSCCLPTQSPGVYRLHQAIVYSLSGKTKSRLAMSKFLNESVHSYVFLLLSPEHLFRSWQVMSAGTLLILLNIFPGLLSC